MAGKDVLDTELADQQKLQDLYSRPGPIEENEWLRAWGLKRGEGEHKDITPVDWADRLAHEFGIETKNVRANIDLRGRQDAVLKMLDPLNEMKQKALMLGPIADAARKAGPTQGDVLRTNPEMAGQLGISPSLSPTAGAISGPEYPPALPGGEPPAGPTPSNEQFTLHPSEQPLTRAQHDLYHPSVLEAAKEPERREARTFRDTEARRAAADRLAQLTVQEEFLRGQSELYKLTAKQQEDLKNAQLEIMKLQKQRLLDDKTLQQNELRFNRDRRSGLGSLGLSSMFIVDAGGTITGFNPAGYQTREADLKKWVEYADKQAEYFKKQGNDYFRERWQHEADSYRHLVLPKSMTGEPGPSGGGNPPPGMSFPEFQEWKRKQQKP